LNIFIYKYDHRKWASYIKIKKEEIGKLDTYHKIEDIKCTSYNDHKHEEKYEIILFSKVIKTKENLENLSIKLISQNISEPYDFHADNFKMNNIDFKPYKIKNLLKLVG